LIAQGDVVGPGEFSGGKVRHGDVIWDWSDLIQAAYLNRVSLSATGFYKTLIFISTGKRVRGSLFIIMRLALPAVRSWSTPQRANIGSAK